MRRIQPFFPKVRGRARSDDCKVLSGIIYVKRYGLRWQDAPAVHGPYKTLYNRFARWSRMGIFARIFQELAQPGAQGDTLMMDSTFLKAHRGQSPKKGDRPRAIGRTKGGLNSKLHMLSDGKGRPLDFLLSPGQMADSRGALVLLRHLPTAKRFLGDKAYDADWLRDGLKDRGIRPCIPPRKKRKKPARYNKRLYRKRYRIENAFGRLKDWRGIVTRYERCGDIFLNAIILAAILIFWI